MISFSLKVVPILLGISFLVSIMVEMYHWYMNRNDVNRVGFSARRWLSTFVSLLLYQGMTIYVWVTQNVVVEPEVVVPVHVKRRNHHRVNRVVEDVKEDEPVVVEDVVEVEKVVEEDEKPKIRTDYPSF